MAEPSSCQQIVICGHRCGTGEVLADLLKASATAPVDVLPGISAFNATPSQGRTLITCTPGDVFGVKRLMTGTTPPATLRVILLIRDPRDLILQRRNDANGEFEFGYDHGLDVSPNGIVTFSDPGVLFTQAVIENLAKRFPQARILRHEDLEQFPDVVRSTLEGFTGLRLASSFSALLSRDPRWSKLTQDGFRHRVDSDALTPEEGERLVRQFSLAPDLLEILDRWSYEDASDRQAG